MRESKQKLYGDIKGESMSLEADVAELLIRNSKTIAVAESCTGGLISQLLTETPGSSKYFKLGIVAYSPQAKISQLNISRKSISEDGAVSSKIALSMAKQIRKAAKTDIGLSVTGIAGGREKQIFEHKFKQGKKRLAQALPVGLVYIGLAGRKEVIFERFQFKGTRKAIRFKAAEAALKMLKKWLI